MIDPANCRLCIDQPQPLFATNGGIHLSGWCFDAATEVAPLVRLTVDDRAYPCSSRLPRPDVGAAFPDFPQAARCGFALKSWMPPGYRKALWKSVPMARIGAGSRLAALCGNCPLIARIDFPTTEVVATTRDCSGWAPPAGGNSKLFLQLGGSSFACHYGKLVSIWSPISRAAQSGRSGFYCQSRSLRTTGSKVKPG